MSRVSGHALRAEGKPCKPRRRGSGFTYEIIHTATGRALCECGARSPELPSDGARRRWHREVHKAEMRSPAAQARALATERLAAHLREVQQLAAKGHIPAARLALDDAMSDLDDIQQLINQETPNG